MDIEKAILDATVAYHEAGHAVAAHALGFKVIVAARVPCPRIGGLGFMQFSPNPLSNPLSFPDCPNAWEADRLAMVRLASYVAEWHVAPRVRYRIEHGDDMPANLIDGHVNRIYFSSDLHGLLDLAKAIYTTKETRQAWIDLNWRRTIDLIVNETNWPAVEAVATRLLKAEDGILHRPQIIDAIGKSWNMDPPFVETLRQRMHAKPARIQVD